MKDYVAISAANLQSGQVEFFDTIDEANKYATEMTNKSHQPTGVYSLVHTFKEVTQVCKVERIE